MIIGPRGSPIRSVIIRVIIKNLTIAYRESDLLITSMIIGIIVSIAKFSILIGSRRDSLSCNWHAITWMSHYTCPIATFCNWIPVIRHLCHIRTQLLHSKRFFLAVSLLFAKRMEYSTGFSIKKDVLKDFLASNLLLIRIISNWTSCRTIQG